MNRVNFLIFRQITIKKKKHNNTCYHSSNNILHIRLIYFIECIILYRYTNENVKTVMVRCIYTSTLLLLCTSMRLKY